MTLPEVVWAVLEFGEKYMESKPMHIFDERSAAVEYVDRVGGHRVVVALPVVYRG